MGASPNFISKCGRPTAVDSASPAWRYIYTDDPLVCVMCERDEGMMADIPTEGGTTVRVCRWCYYGETHPDEMP